MAVDGRTLAPACFQAGVSGVAPDRLIREQVRVDRGTLRIGAQAVDLEKCRRILVVGAGKASGLMAQTLEEVLGGRVAGGAVTVKYGHAASCRRIKVLEAAHP